jgi:hypothetical protein
MKYALLFFVFILLRAASYAGPGDTIVVQTFTFGSPQDAWFVFPSDTISFEKILMKYTLKCNPAQNPACGEWDYLTYTYLYNKTGGLDSSVVHQPTFLVNGNITNSVDFITTPAYTYPTSWQHYITYSDTLSLNTATVGNGSQISAFPFVASGQVSRTQYLWRASELTAAGLSAGNISGLRFYVQSNGSPLRNLTIRIKAVTSDTLDVNNVTHSGYSTVYLKNTTFTGSGWNSLPLTLPFLWNGTSNLLIDISFSNTSAGNDSPVLAETTSYTSGLTCSGADRSVFFHSAGYVDVPLNNQLEGLDSTITVCFWAYGTPEYQPQNGTCFEAVDSAGNRILNAHVPWSDGTVYWDAGSSGGSYDRISKAAPPTYTEGAWTFWAFTKNTVTGSMKIYQNGTQWLSGTGKTKAMNNIRSFRIGKGNWNGSQTYEGHMDEFAVFNRELTLQEIQQIKAEKILPSHPQYSSLILYYNFNDGNYFTAADAAPAAHSPAHLYATANLLKQGSDIVSGYSSTQVRPNIIFEQGTFISSADSVFVVDTLLIPPMQIITFTDSINNPGSAVDTLLVWPPYYYNYQYNTQGQATDSTLSVPVETMQLAYYDYYVSFPEVERYELARYITPYGNGLSLGNGWTWTFDVSDYRTLLTDSVHLAAGNWQELLDMRFLFIEGTPPREVISIQNLWNGGFNYGSASDPIESHLTEIDIDLPSNAVNARWKSRITGHGMDSPQNCAEFCAKYHYFKVNGNTEFSKLVWRDNCDLNPLYPQGGTWVYDRANWCPGAEVWTYDFELTPFITPGGSIILDHDVQPYTSYGPWDYYQIEDQLVVYGAPSFTLDASLEYIISPSSDQMWLRQNPICTKPVIVIKNTGATTLTSLTITYGINGANPSVFNWSGNLPFMETETISLDHFEWAENAGVFTCTLSNPNGGNDQYAYNNTKASDFAYVLSVPSEFIIELKTNTFSYENYYTLKDAQGNIIHERSNLNPNIYYRDTLSLETGCYEFELWDSGEDGLSFWANSSQGTGFIRFRKVSPATTIKSFISDFGGQIFQQFTVGLNNNMEEYIPNKISSFKISPNPSHDSVVFSIELNSRCNGTVEVFSMLGKQVYYAEFSNTFSERIEAGFAHLERGMYVVRMTTGNEVITKKLVLK